MSEIIIAVIALTAMVWVLVVERTEDRDAVNTETQEQLLDNRLAKFGPKVLGAIFQHDDFTGRWYEDGRLDILRKGELIETLFLVEKDRAEFDFLYQIRNDG